MSNAETHSHALNDEELKHVAGGSAPWSEIDLPLDEFNALQKLNPKILKQFSGPGWTKDRFYSEIAPGLNPYAVSALLKITGHEEWLHQGGHEGISG
jgi:hypothetical protein